MEFLMPCPGTLDNVSATGTVVANQVLFDFFRGAMSRGDRSLRGFSNYLDLCPVILRHAAITLNTEPPPVPRL